MNWPDFHFASTPPIDTSAILTCSYSHMLVALSYLVASAAAYTALDMADRVASVQRSRARSVWCWIGAFCMGGGIWSMHFVGMLAFEVPVIVRYDLMTTLMSLMIAVLVSRLAMGIISLPVLSRREYLQSGLLIGLGIAAMHYSGMAALRSVASQYYDPWWVLVSVVIAAAASWVALLLSVYFRGRNARAHKPLKLAASLTMGGAIVSMHFTGMAALQLVVPLDTPLPLHPVAENLQLGVFIGLITLLIIAAGVGAAYAGKQFDNQGNALRKASALVRELEQSHSTLRQFASSDVLTGLYNRRALGELFESMIGRQAQRMAVLLLDLDHFKQVNDTLGHGAGDELLRIIADRIAQSSRDNDIVARFGGDEFCMLASLHQHEEARLVAQRLMYRMREPVLLDGRTLHMGASIGISIYPDDGLTLEELIRNADLALYQSKGSGRNRACFFNAELKTRIESELQMESELRAALAERKLLVQYQPVLQLCGDCVEKLVAQVCWPHPQSGLLTSERFLFIAEARGLIDEIEELLFERICDDLLCLRQQGYPQVRIVMQCAARNLFDEAFPERLLRVLRERDLQPDQLELAIAENALTANIEKVMDVLLRLARTGFRLTLDGYGAGSTSLTQLLQLPFDAIKIDRSLIANIPGASRDRTIVTAVIAVARNFKLRVMADGVDTQEQRLFLAEQGCDQIQGDCAAKAAPLEELLPGLTPCSGTNLRRHTRGALA